MLLQELSDSVCRVESFVAFDRISERGISQGCTVDVIFSGI